MTAHSALKKPEVLMIPIKIEEIVTDFPCCRNENECPAVARCHQKSISESISHPPGLLLVWYTTAVSLKSAAMKGGKVWYQPIFSWFILHHRPHVLSTVLETPHWRPHILSTTFTATRDLTVKSSKLYEKLEPNMFLLFSLYLGHVDQYTIRIDHVSLSVPQTSPIHHLLIAINWDWMKIKEFVCLLR